MSSSSINLAILTATTPDIFNKYVLGLNVSNMPFKCYSQSKT